MNPKKVAVVVGAGDATGGAIAERFAAEGYAVCAIRRNGDKLASLVAKIEEIGGQAHAFGVDARIEGGGNEVSSRADWFSLMASLRSDIIGP